MEISRGWLMCKKSVHQWTSVWKHRTAAKTPNKYLTWQIPWCQIRKMLGSFVRLVHNISFNSTATYWQRQGFLMWKNSTEHKTKLIKCIISSTSCTGVHWQTSLTTTLWPFECPSVGSLKCENTSYWDLPPAGLDVQWWAASSSPCPPRNHPTPPSRSFPAGALRTPTHNTINIDNLENRIWILIRRHCKAFRQAMTGSSCPNNTEKDTS